MNTTAPIYLIGGGWRPEVFPETYGRFLEACGAGQRIAIIAAEEPGVPAGDTIARFTAAFVSAGLDADLARGIPISGDRPLTRAMLDGQYPAGVFVCGGLTPSYHDALCRDLSWLPYLTEKGIPYCGFSAGAAIAPEKALVGGWLRRIGDSLVRVADENAGEDLELLDVRAGSGLVPFTVDVHATQWGTLSRLVHAVAGGLTDAGWAIDEDTMLEVRDGTVKVHGIGCAYLIRRAGGSSTVQIFNSGDTVNT